MDLPSGPSSTLSITIPNQTGLAEISVVTAKVETFKSFTFFRENIKEMLVTYVITK
jgi:hypothetical protein